jgi:tRNA (guanosine-2'-O-)-methyltransferase
MNSELIKYLETFVTDQRKNTFNEVLMKRTKYLTVVLEDIFQPQNASAVLRTSECLGIQDVHIIENQNKYNLNPDVVMGANYWITLHKYKEKQENTKKTIHSLKNQGYRIIATTPHKNDTTPEHFDLHKGKAALVFGTELTGLSDVALEMADEFIQIPISGFTESYNISVSAAIVLYTLTQRLQNSNINWHLTEEDKNELKLLWLRHTIKKCNLIEKHFHDSIKNI